MPRDQKVSFVLFRGTRASTSCCLRVSVCGVLGGFVHLKDLMGGQRQAVAACGRVVVYRGDWCCACGEAWHEQHSHSGGVLLGRPLPPLRSSSSNMLPCMHVTLVCERLTDTLCHSLLARVSKGTTHMLRHAGHLSG